ncbi:hypothetical protein D3C80_1230710 [compost metagenome]
MGRAEEVQADHVLRAAGAGGDAVDIQGRGVAGQDRAGLAHPVEGAKHRLLDRQVLEYCLDHQVSVSQVGIVEGALQQAHALFELRGGQLAAGDAAFVVFADLRQATVQRLGLELQQAHRQTRVDEVHGDAGAHGAGADHGDLSDAAQRGGSVDTRHPQSLAFGEELVTQCRGLGVLQGFAEQCLLACQALGQGQLAGRAQRCQHPQRCPLAGFACSQLRRVRVEEVIGQAL